MSWLQQQNTEQQQYEEAWGGVKRATLDRFYGQASAVDRRMEKKMGLIVSDAGGDFKIVPPGTHIARCWRYVDLGTQEVVWEGDKKLQRKVQMSWELFGEDEEGNALQTDEGMPLTISKRYTSSLVKNARLRADLEAWRGRAFTEAELKGFDLGVLLGKFCMLNVIHTTKDSKTYANIASITPIPGVLKKQLPEGVHELQTFDVTSPDMVLFETFHAKLQDVIKQSLEWRNQNGKPKQTEIATTASGYSGDPDEDIPF